MKVEEGKEGQSGNQNQYRFSPNKDNTENNRNLFIDWMNPEDSEPREDKRVSATGMKPLFEDSDVVFMVKEEKPEPRASRQDRGTSADIKKDRDDRNKNSKTQDIKKRNPRAKFKRRLKLKLNMKKLINTIQEVPTILVETQEIDKAVKE